MKDAVIKKNTIHFIISQTFQNTHREQPKSFHNIPSLIARDPLRGTTAIFCRHTLSSGDVTLLLDMAFIEAKLNNEMWHPQY